MTGPDDDPHEVTVAPDAVPDLLFKPALNLTPIEWADRDDLRARFPNRGKPTETAEEAEAFMRAVAATVDLTPMKTDDYMFFNGFMPAEDIEALRLDGIRDSQIPKPLTEQPIRDPDDFAGIQQDRIHFGRAHVDASPEARAKLSDEGRAIFDKLPDGPAGSKVVGAAKNRKQRRSAKAKGKGKKR